MRDGRKLRRGVGRKIEQLEVRMLLAVTPAEYASICSTYPDFALPASMSQINIIEIASDQLNVANLKAAIAAAGNTALPDLVVLRTTATSNTITLPTPADEIAIDVPGSQGAISIVGFGTNPLSITDLSSPSAGSWRVFNIGSGGSTTTVNLGAMSLSGGGGYGGVILQTKGTLRVQNTYLKTDTSVIAGGDGSDIYSTDGTLYLKHVRLNGGIPQYGGACFLANATSTFVDVQVLGGGQNGGGIYASGGSLTLLDSNISGKVTAYGGGIYCNGSTLTMTGGSITHSQSGYGGGLYADHASVTLTNVAVIGNEAEFGGGICQIAGTMTLTNVVIGGNSLLGGTSVPSGPGMYQASGTSLLTNVTIADNNSAGAPYDTTGSVHLESNAVMTLNNSVIAANSGGATGDIWTNYGSSGQISGSNNLIGDGTGAPLLMNGIHGNLVGTSASPINPQFISTDPDPGVTRVPWPYYGNLRVKGTSPAINAGANALLPSGLTTDVDGLPRVVGGTVDMGAYEYSSPVITLTPVEYATIRGTYPEFGLPVDMSQTNIVEIPADQLTVNALNKAIARAQGTALPDLIVLRTTSTDYTVSVDWLSDGVNPVCLRGEISVVGLGPSQPVISSSAAAVSGASLLTVPSSATLNLGGVQIVANTANCYGITAKGLLRLSNARVDAAAAGAMALNASYSSARGDVGSLVVYNVTFNGAVFIDSWLASNSSFSFRNVIFGGQGGTDGYAQNGGTSSLTNALFLGCHRAYALAFTNSARSTITNATIVGNSGGISLSNGAQPTMNNSIVALNTSNGGHDILKGPVTLISGSYNLIGDGTGQTGFVNGVKGNKVGTAASPIDPRFVDTSSADPVQWNAHLRSDSPAVNAGSNALIASGVTADLGGGARIVGGTVDMGAYEYAPSPAVTGFTVNDGSAQRSMVTKLVVTFSTPVTIADGAITLLRRNGAVMPNVVVNKANSPGEQMTWELTFSGSGTQNGSLPDGTYRLMVSAAGVADMSGTHMASDYAHRFYRLFGDSDGNRLVNRTDLVAMRNVLTQPGSAAPWFDYDGNGTIDVNDLRQLRARLRRVLL